MAVAIRTITRLQDADDVNVSLGAGVDEYALSWDNDTAKFVLRAVAGGGVTDHGALTGLTPDDDHTQYALLAVAAGALVAVALLVAVMVWCLRANEEMDGDGRRWRRCDDPGE